MLAQVRRNAKRRALAHGKTREVKRFEKRQAIKRQRAEREEGVGGDAGEVTRRVKRAVRRSDTTPVQDAKENLDLEALRTKALEKSQREEEGRRQEAEAEKKRLADQIYPEGTPCGDRVRFIFYNLRLDKEMHEFTVEVQRTIKTWIPRIRSAERLYLAKEANRTKQVARAAGERIMRTCYQCRAPETLFVHDKASGDEICTSCGLVLSSRRADEGEMYRSFEGEEDRSHHDKNKRDPRLSQNFGTVTVINGTGSMAKRLQHMERKAYRTVGGRIADRGEFLSAYGGTTVAYAESEKRKYLAALDGLLAYSIVPRRVVERAKWLACRARDTLESIASVRTLLTAACVLAYDEFGVEPKMRYLCLSCKTVFKECKERDVHQVKCEAAAARTRYWKHMEKQEEKMRRIEERRRKRNEKKYPGLFL